MKEIKLRARVDGGFLYWTLGKDGENLMLCTGMQDKNGKEIYEGDLLSESNDVSVVIKWCNTLACFYVAYHDGGKYGIFHAPGRIKRMEVIGSIYDNPELFKEN